MPLHSENIKAFKAIAMSQTNLIAKAYCGMVSIELVLKDATNLRDHDIPGGLNAFALKFATNEAHKSGCKAKINSLSTQLGNALKNIYVQGIDSKPRQAPQNCYPYIRYTRHANDGWPEPYSTDTELKILSDVVQATRVYLLEKFSKDC
ncbi:hypothetical protein [Aeromonas caviae]|uniref:hypothetical protein n=1 Tax=Aeromonas caviae TaxID=648 RepID=UPI002B49A98D|nr:hypothetical protein [Aeromonas caviae]